MTEHSTKIYFMTEFCPKYLRETHYRSGQTMQRSLISVKDLKICTLCIALTSCMCLVQAEMVKQWKNKQTEK